MDHASGRLVAPTPAAALPSGAAPPGCTVLPLDPATAAALNAAIAEAVEGAARSLVDQYQASLRGIFSIALPRTDLLFPPDGEVVQACLQDAAERAVYATAASEQSATAAYDLHCKLLVSSTHAEVMSECRTLYGAAVSEYQRWCRDVADPPSLRQSKVLVAFEAFAQDAIKRGVASPITYSDFERVAALATTASALEAAESRPDWASRGPAPSPASPNGRLSHPAVLLEVTAKKKGGGFPFRVINRVLQLLPDRTLQYFDVSAGQGSTSVMTQMRDLLSVPSTGPASPAHASTSNSSPARGKNSEARGSIRVTGKPTVDPIDPLQLCVTGLDDTRAIRKWELTFNNAKDRDAFIIAVDVLDDSAVLAQQYWSDQNSAPLSRMRAMVGFGSGEILTVPWTVPSLASLSTPAGTVNSGRATNAAATASPHPCTLSLATLSDILAARCLISSTLQLLWATRAEPSLHHMLFSQANLVTSAFGRLQAAELRKLRVALRQMCAFDSEPHQRLQAAAVRLAESKHRLLSALGAMRIPENDGMKSMAGWTSDARQAFTELEVVCNAQAAVLERAMRTRQTMRSALAGAHACSFADAVADPDAAVSWIAVLEANIAPHMQQVAAALEGEGQVPGWAMPAFTADEKDECDVLVFARKAVIPIARVVVEAKRSALAAYTELQVDESDASQRLKRLEDTNAECVSRIREAAQQVQRSGDVDLAIQERPWVLQIPARHSVQQVAVEAFSTATSASFTAAVAVVDAQVVRNNAAAFSADTRVKSLANRFQQITATIQADVNAEVSKARSAFEVGRDEFKKLLVTLEGELRALPPYAREGMSADANNRITSAIAEARAALEARDRIRIEVNSRAVSLTATLLKLKENTSSPVTRKADAFAARKAAEDLVRSRGGAVLAPSYVESEAQQLLRTTQATFDQVLMTLETQKRVNDNAERAFAAAVTEHTRNLDGRFILDPGVSLAQCSRMLDSQAAAVLSWSATLSSQLSMATVPAYVAVPIVEKAASLAAELTTNARKMLAERTAIDAIYQEAVAAFTALVQAQVPNDSPVAARKLEVQRIVTEAQEQFNARINAIEPGLLSRTFLDAIIAYFGAEAKKQFHSFNTVVAGQQKAMDKIIAEMAVGQQEAMEALRTSLFDVDDSLVATQRLEKAITAADRWLRTITETSGSVPAYQRGPFVAAEQQIQDAIRDVTTFVRTKRDFADQASANVFALQEALRKYYANTAPPNERREAACAALDRHRAVNAAIITKSKELGMRPPTVAAEGFEAAASKALTQVMNEIKAHSRRNSEIHSAVTDAVWKCANELQSPFETADACRAVLARFGSREGSGPLAIPLSVSQQWLTGQCPDYCRQQMQEFAVSRLQEAFDEAAQRLRDLELSQSLHSRFNLHSSSPGTTSAATAIPAPAPALASPLSARPVSYAASTLTSPGNPFG